MNRIKEFAENHFIVSVIVAGLLTIIACDLAIWWVKCLLGWICKGINHIFKFFIKFLLTKEHWEQLIELCNLSQYQGINAITFYLVLCLLVAISVVILTVLIMLLLGCIQGGIDKIDNVVFGEKHQKSLEYTGVILWFIKCKADILFFLHWLRFDVLKIRYSYGSENTPTTWARRFSLENITIIAGNVMKFFFETTILHFALGAIALYAYFGKDFLALLGDVKTLIMQGEITASQFIEIFEVITIVSLLSYIAFDIRHKANGYSDLRADRFKELVQMEEKLLNILAGIRYSLEKNIDVISNRKCYILQSAAAGLSGKQCYFDNNKIKFIDKRGLGYWGRDDGVRQLSDLEDMEDEFRKLSELEGEFRKSSLSYWNIPLVDHQAMLINVVHFWIPGVNDMEYMRMQFFCKSSMEKWYKNCFVNPIKNEDGYFSERETEEKILEASVMLDYELMRAFWLELYMKKYERKMIKRFKGMNKFSRFSLN